ncbi:MAG: hypothetical protein OXI79_09595 [Gammaproteobacteria bacterium]|nr:hypothetical protein [Gammaproteobacteria bacterium]
MRTIFGMLFTLALALPAEAQEPPDSTDGPEVGTQSARFPVWLLVEDVEHEAGAHRVYATVEWEDWRTGFRFSEEVLPGELMVLVAKSEDPASAETCDYTSALMLHGSEEWEPMERADTDCLAPPVENLPWIAVDYRGLPMACTEAKREDGIEDPSRRFFACYFAEKPGEG